MSLIILKEADGIRANMAPYSILASARCHIFCEKLYITVTIPHIIAEIMIKFLRFNFSVWPLITRTIGSKDIDTHKPYKRPKVSPVKPFMASFIENLSCILSYSEQ